MKKNFIIISILLFLAAITGYVLSKISLVGRVGINLFYRNYSFLKVWWKDALLVFICWMSIFLVQWWLRKRTSAVALNLFCSVILVIAAGGLYLSYHDFRHSISHRLLGERFHLGVYLFWITLIILVIITRNKLKTNEPGKEQLSENKII